MESHGAERVSDDLEDSIVNGGLNYASSFNLIWMVFFEMLMSQHAFKSHSSHLPLLSCTRLLLLVELPKSSPFHDSILA